MRRVAIVDDSPDIRALWRAELESSGDFVVCAEGDDGRQAAEIASSHQPDVMLLDLSMPGLGGMEAIPLVREASPDTQIVVLSGMGRHQFSGEALSLGARAFLDKRLPAGSLTGRLHEALGDRPGAVDGPEPTGPLLVTVEPGYDDGCLLQYLLEWRGYRIHPTSSAAQALQSLSAEAPAAVLLACPLPDMRISDFAELARAETGPHHRIALIGMANHHRYDALLHDTLDAVLYKPIGAQALHEALRAWVPPDGASEVDALLDDESLRALRVRIGPDTVQAILAEFRTRARERLAHLRCAVDSGDTETAGRLAHQIAGSARSLGASRLARAAENLERSARHGSTAELREAAGRLSALLEQTEGAMAVIPPQRTPEHDAC